MKKHVKRTEQQQGGIITIEAPLHVSNVALVDPVTGCAYPALPLCAQTSSNCATRRAVGQGGCAHGVPVP